MAVVTASASRAFAALAALFLVAACGEGNADYFPLAAGTNWQYRIELVTRNTGNAGGVDRQVVKQLAANLEPAKVAGQKLTPRLFHDGRLVYYARDTEGVTRMALGNMRGEVIPLDPPQTVLKLPLRVGDTWKEPSETQVLKRLSFGPTGSVTRRIAVAVELNVTVESLGDTVRVPAGTFRRCLRLKATGSGLGDVGQPYGVLPLSIEAVLWYAPGVGLVKTVRHEISGADSPLAGDMIAELESVSGGPWFR